MAFLACFVTTLFWSIYLLQITVQITILSSQALLNTSFIFQAECKFLIFAHHQSMLEAIHQHLLKKKVKCIRIDGQTPVPVRQTLVTDFQNKDDIKAAVVCVRICMLYIY
jgi:SNF2 family DNA or RNA helicase